MNNIDQLRQLMTLDVIMKTFDIEERFEKIAKMLFESFAIQKGEKARRVDASLRFEFHRRKQQLGKRLHDGTVGTDGTEWCGLPSCRWRS